MKLRLEGKSLIITGASSGIGKAAAIGAAEQGASVILADVNDTAGSALAGELLEAGHKARFVHCDIANPDDVAAMVRAAVESYGRLDGAFNNAGVPNANLRLTDTPLEVFQHTHAVNSTGTFLCIKAEIEAMLKTGGGSIVNTSSSGAIATLPNMTDYGSAKAAVLAMTRSAALEYGRAGIRVNAILPGPTETKMLLERMAEHPEMLTSFVASLPTGRIASAREVANVALWLLSDEASVVTGASIPADGGLTIL